MSAFMALAVPNSETRYPGWSAAVAEVAARARETLTCAWLLSPATSKVTRIERPSRERNSGLTVAPGAATGDAMPATVGSRSRRPTRSSTTTENCAFVGARAPRTCISTSSALWNGNASS